MHVARHNNNTAHTKWLPPNSVGLERLSYMYKANGIALFSPCVSVSMDECCIIIQSERNDAKREETCSVNNVNLNF